MKRILIGTIILFSMTANSQQLHSGDGLRLVLYNVTEKITGDYFIQIDGKIQLPYVGNIDGEGREFEDIKNEVTAKFDSLYKNPELTIQPLLKINILGEVRQPGYYYLTGVEKLPGLMAMAGGETSDADVDDMYIIRNDKELPIDSEQLIADGGTVKDIGLQSGDRIFVPRSWWVGAINASVIVSGIAVMVMIVSLFVN